MVKKSAGINVGVFQVLADLTGGDPAVVAKRAEDLGFESYWLPEHMVIPNGSLEVYPGKQGDEPAPDYLSKMPDPMIGLSRAATTTSSIRLGTGIALVPQRNPILAAKEIATLDHYSGGRFIFGIGAGWNEAECTVMGGDFEHRWTQTHEAILAMKALWTEEDSEHHGSYFDFPPVACFPKPTQKPHPPIMLGSIGSPRVFKRVAKWGDGWLPFSADLAEVAAGKAEIAKYAEQFDRDPATLTTTLFAPEGLFRTQGELQEAANVVDGAVIWLQGKTQAEVLEELDELAGAIF